MHYCTEKVQFTSNIFKKHAFIYLLFTKKIKIGDFKSNKFLFKLLINEISLDIQKERFWRILLGSQGSIVKIYIYETVL